MFYLGFFLLFYFGYCFIPSDHVQTQVNVSLLSPLLTGIGTRSVTALGMTAAWYCLYNFNP